MKFLHTADWQLGLKLNFLPKEAAARARSLRFEAVRRMAQIAQDRNVSAVVVAGDVFDDNAVGDNVLQQARDALATFGEIPVILIPGNHDPGTPDSALLRLAKSRNTRVCLTHDPIQIGDLVIHPCPVLRRHEIADPAATLPDIAADPKVHVALVHGAVLGFGEETETPRLIAVDALLNKGYDYVALGDWHGTLQFRDRAWYSGTPEATRFKEKDPGNALVVTIDRHGSLPQVERVPVARTRWLTEAQTLTADDQVELLHDRLQSLPELGSSLVALSLAGQLSLCGRARLDDVLLRMADRFLHLDAKADALQCLPTEGDFAALAADPFLNRVIAALRAEPGDAVRAQALQLMYRFAAEASHP